MSKGWYGQGIRHSLAARGIKTYYHGSDSKFDKLKPFKSGINTKGVFMSDEKFLALTFAARADEFKVVLSYVDGVLTLTETEPGGLKQFSKPGFLHIIKLDDKEVFVNPFWWAGFDEYISRNDVEVKRVERIPNIMTELKKFEKKGKVKIVKHDEVYLVDIRKNWHRVEGFDFKMGKELGRYKANKEYYIVPRDQPYGPRDKIKVNKVIRTKVRHLPKYGLKSSMGHNKTVDVIDYKLLEGSK